MQSRAFFLGYLISGFFLFKKRINFLPSYRFKWILAGAFIIILFLLFFIKYDSSLGRILIYKVSFNLFKDHYLTGVGLGRFPFFYLKYQSDFFKSGIYTQQELLLADNTQHAFNDYWQFVIEIGISGIFICLIGFSMLFLLIKRTLDRGANSIMTKAAIFQVSGIAIAAFFTHVFELFFFQTIFILSLTCILKIEYSVKSKIIGVLIIPIVLIIFFLHWGFYFVNYSSFKKLEEAKLLQQAGYLTESMEVFDQLNTNLKNDPAFLIAYANVLSACNNYPKAEVVLKDLVKQHSNNVLYDKLAFAYFKNKKFKKSEKAYLTSINMVPNRFIPRFHLYQFYKNQGQDKKATDISNDIINLPVKVPSNIIDNIKQEVLLNNLPFCP